MPYLTDGQRDALVEYLSKCELHVSILREDPNYIRNHLGLAVVQDSFEVREVELPNLKGPAVQLRFVNHLTWREFLLYGEHFSVEKVRAFLASLAIPLAAQARMCG